MKRWTKLKKRVESLFAPCLRNRARFLTATYRKAGHEIDYAGYLSLAIDKVEVMKVGTVELRGWQGTLPTEVLADPCSLDLSVVDKHSIQPLVPTSSVRRPDILDLLVEYCETPIETVIASKDPVIRGIGMLDRRVGKKRLRELLNAESHPLVQLLICVRLQAEGSGSVK